MLRWSVRLNGAPKGIRHPAVAVGYKVYCFGYLDGRTKGQIEVNIFNTVSSRWTTLPPETAGRGEPPLEVPSMRYGHTAVLREDIIYIWGGKNDYNNGCCNVLYALDVDTHRWFIPKVSGTVPTGRLYHSACILGKVMFIHGGVIQLTGHTNDIYKLDTNTMVWSSINTRGTAAPESSYHSATIIGTKMFVFGGRDDRTNKIRVFDTETNCWLTMPSTQILPEERESHSAFAHNGELYIFGGDDWEQTYNDLWKFSPETLSWKKVEPKGKDPCSWMTDMCCCMVGDRVVLCGGIYTSIPEDVEDEVEDLLYILDMSPSLKTLCKLAVIQYGLEQTELTHDMRWEMAAMTSNINRKKVGLGLD